MALTRRTKPKSTVAAPKALPSRGKEEEPETTKCEDVRTAVLPKDKEPKLGKCIDCGLFAANSEADKLCYNCHRTKAGFVFDEEKNLWVKKGKK